MDLEVLPFQSPEMELLVPSWEVVYRTWGLKGSRPHVAHSVAVREVPVVVAVMVAAMGEALPGELWDPMCAAQQPTSLWMPKVAGEWHLLVAILQACLVEAKDSLLLPPAFSYSGFFAHAVSFSLMLDHLHHHHLRCPPT